VFPDVLVSVPASPPAPTTTLLWLIVLDAVLSAAELALSVPPPAPEIPGPVLLSITSPAPTLWTPPDELVHAARASTLGNSAASDPAFKAA